MFGRKYITRLPDMRSNPAKNRTDIKEGREADKKAKANMKKYKDKGRYLKPHDIKEGDKVLLKRKTTKHEGPYDPKSY